MTQRYDVIVVGAGIAGLAAAHRLASTRPDLRLCVIERDRAVGGKITTEHVDGFVIEGGPDCFLAGKPAGIALCRTLGLDAHLRGTVPTQRRSFVKRNGTLHQLPAGLSGMVPARLAPLLMTRTLSVPGRVRAALEYIVPRRTDNADESIAEFAIRRFGREAYEWLIEPLMAGIHAGDGERLNLAATFPHLQEHERTTGSVLRTLAASRNSRTSDSPFLTPSDGMGTLVDGLIAAMPNTDIELETLVTRVVTRQAGYAIELGSGETHETTSVIVATPAFVTSELLEDATPRLRKPLSEIEHVSTAVVTLAFKSAQFAHPLRGTGYVCPRAAGGPVVACSWTSNKFDNRAPAGSMLLRVFIGRAGVDDIVRKSDDALVDVAYAEVAQVLGIRGPPLLTRIARWPRGLPQYNRGHLERVAQIDMEVAKCPGLALAGASYKGVGIPDCIESGWAAAERVCPSLSAGS